MLLVRKTRNLLLLFLAGSLLGCATPQTNPWDSVETPSEAIEAPLPCAELPEPEAFDEIGKGRIAAMRECAVANYDIASEHVEQIEDMRDAVQNLIEAGQAQRRIADMKETMLQDERKHHFWQSLGYWVMIAGAVAL